MRKLLVVLDCLRYEYAGKFQFDGFQHLSQVVSVSNWSMPVVATLLTGLHPVEHKVGLRPCTGHPTELTLLRAVSLGAYREINHPMLLDKYRYKIVTEPPIYDLATPDGYRSEGSRANNFEGLRKAEKYLADGEIEFMIYHAKGGHYPYALIGEKAYEHNHKSEEAEIDALAVEMDKFIAKARDKFDRIAIITDHGSMWPELDAEMTRTAFGHGDQFGLANLHVPCWLYPDEKAPDVLYDSRVVYQFLEQQPLISRQLVFSTTPAYNDYHRFAVSYLVKGELVVESFQTKEAYDLEEKGATDKRGNR